MKKSLVLFFLCLVLTLGGAVAGVLAVHGDRDQVVITENTAKGDRSAAQGLVAKQTVQAANHLTWDLTIPLGEPEKATAEFTHLAGNELLDAFSYPRYGMQVQSLRFYASPYNSSGATLDELLAENYHYPYSPEPLTDLLREADRQIPAGETKTVTLPLKQYMDTYPLGSGMDLPCDSKYDAETQMINDFFQFPVLEEETFNCKMIKNPDGTIAEVATDYALFQLDFSSANIVLDDHCFFTFSSDIQEIEGLDFSLVPGGFGIYRLDYPETNDGIHELDTDSLRNVYPLDPDAAVLTFALSPDEKDLILTTWLDGEYRCTILDPDTMTARQSFRIPAAAPASATRYTTTGAGAYQATIREYSISTLRQGENCLLFCGYDTFFFFAREPGGEYSLICSGENDRLPLCKLGVDTSTSVCVAWNGEKLAVGKTLDSSQDPGLFLYVYDTSGDLLYRGIYETSLEDRPGAAEESGLYLYQHGPYGLTASPVPGRALTLAWEE